MAWHWQLTDSHAEIFVIGQGEEPPERGEPLAGYVAAAELDRLSDPHALSKGTFEHPQAGSAEASSPQDIRDALRSALIGGVLQGFRRPILDISRPLRTSDEPLAEPVDIEPIAASWIEIELVDMEDNPVGGERYELTLPDGSIVAGTTSGRGRIRIPSADAGSCKLVFVDLDQEAWEEA